MAQSNLFNVEGRAFVAQPSAGDLVSFAYHADARVDAVQHAGGSLAPILNDRVVVGGLRATPGLWTGTLTARLYAGSPSLFRRAHDTNCPLHVRINYGNCNDPTDLTDYTDAILLEEVYITDYATTALTAVQPSEVALIQETLTFSCRDMRPLSTLTLRPAGTPFTTNEVLCLTFAERSEGSLIRRVIALLSPATSGLASYVLAWSDDDGLSWSSATIDSTYLAPGTAEVSKIVVLGDYLVGMNFVGAVTSLWSITLSSLADSATLTPILINALGQYSGDLKVLGDYAYVPMLNGDIVRVDKQLVATLVVSTGISNVGAFCPLASNHFLFSTFDGTGSKIYETLNGVTRLIPGTNRDQYVAQITTRPDGYVLVAYIYGYVYGKPKNSDDFSLLMNTLATDCINQVVMVSNLVGYAAGAYLYQTLDGGATWAKLTTAGFTENTYCFVALAADEQRIFSGGALKAISPIDYSTYIGVYGSDSGILVSTPG